MPLHTKEEMRDRLQIAINHQRLRCGWDWALANEHCRETFGAIVQDMNNQQLFRFYKDLCELRKFQEFGAKRTKTSVI